MLIKSKKVFVEILSIFFKKCSAPHDYSAVNFEKDHGLFLTIKIIRMKNFKIYEI